MSLAQFKRNKKELPGKFSGELLFISFLQYFGQVSSVTAFSDEDFDFVLDEIIVGDSTLPEALRTLDEKKMTQAGFGGTLNKIESYNNSFLFQGDDSPNVVRYWRVQGGTRNNSSQERILVKKDGTVSINSHEKNLSISAYNDQHAQYFLDKRGADAYIISLDVPKWFDDFLQEYAVQQKNYRHNIKSQNGMAPKIVDPNQPGHSYELPPPWIEWLEEYARNARIFKKRGGT